MTLGQRIQELRKQAGLTQEQLAERMGVTRQAVSKWESDGGVPELDTLIAMSRLFHVTIGQLLGVEEAQRPGNSGDGGPRPEGAGLDEEQVEAILRRYVEATRAQRQAPPSPPSMYGKYGWKAPLIAVAGLATLVVLLGLFIGSMNSTISNMRATLSNLQTTVWNWESEMANMQSQIQQMQEEQQAGPIDDFGWNVVSFDQETVDLMWRVSLKEYDGDTLVQVILEQEGGAWYASQWSDAPDFIGYLTEVPMAESYSCNIRIQGGDGRIREYEMDPIYSLTEEAFQLSASSLSGLYSVSVGNSVSATAEDPAVRVVSPYPELFRPISAQLTVTLNGEVLETTTLSLTEEETGVWYGRDDQGVRRIRLEWGDVLDFSLLLRDSLGRETVCASSILGDENAPRESTAPVEIN